MIKLISSHKKCVDKLRLSSTKASQLLNNKTLTGTKQVTSSKVQIPFHDGVYLDAYILDSNLVLQSEKEINVGLLWPTLDKQLAKEVKNNIVKGRIDIIVGLDQLYGKFSNTNSIRHPYKRLALLNTIFGFSIGGSTEDYLDGGTKLDMLVSNLEMTKTEPTEETNEKGIQQLTERLFTC